MFALWKSKYFLNFTLLDFDQSIWSHGKLNTNCDRTHDTLHTFLKTHNLAITQLSWCKIFWLIFKVVMVIFVLSKIFYHPYLSQNWNCSEMIIMYQILNRGAKRITGNRRFPKTKFIDLTLLSSDYSDWKWKQSHE